MLEKSSILLWQKAAGWFCPTFNPRRVVVSGDLTDFGFEVIGSPCGVSQRKKKIFKGKRSTGRTKGRRRIIGRIKGIKRNNSRTLLPLCSVRPRPQRNTIAQLTQSEFLVHLFWSISEYPSCLLTIIPQKSDLDQVGSWERIDDMQGALFYKYIFIRSFGK